MDFNSMRWKYRRPKRDEILVKVHATFRSTGYFPETPHPYADLGEIVTGKKPERETDSERTFAVNLGITLEDMATAIQIYERAKVREIEIELPL